MAISTHVHNQLLYYSAVSQNLHANYKWPQFNQIIGSKFKQHQLSSFINSFSDAVYIQKTLNECLFIACKLIAVDSLYMPIGVSFPRFKNGHLFLVEFPMTTRSNTFNLQHCEGRIPIRSVRAVFFPNRYAACWYFVVCF